MSVLLTHLFFLHFLNAVWALTSSGFRIVSDTLVCSWHSESSGRHKSVDIVLF